jgi:hypothetical protein
LFSQTSHSENSYFKGFLSKPITMFDSTSSAIVVLGLLGLTSAIPTPIELAPRCGSTIIPTILQQVSEENPSAVGANTMQTGGDFHVSQSVGANGNIINRITQAVAFQDIPAGSYGCQLAVTFPANYPITSTGHPTLNVTTLLNGQSSDITYPNDLSWSSLYAPDSSIWEQGLFGTVTIAPGTTQIINSEACPVGGGNLAFVFSIAVWETQAANVAFNEYDNSMNGAGLAGVYLTYDC